MYINSTNDYFDTSVFNKFFVAKLLVIGRLFHFFQIRPVLDELGIATPEDLGYDKPEFFIPQPEYWWEKKWYVFCSDF